MPPSEFYTTREAAHAAVPPTEGANARYPHFKQVLFTAGDEDQFEVHRQKITLSSENPTPVVEASLEFPRQIRWPGYQHLQPGDVLTTYRYLAHKFKKGIFVQIKDNQLRVFLPFSKNN
jgi:hypothetical protein